ncbi:MAG: hypothetical protein Q8N55_01540 [bacterium]|nr:hypothetical protein [bacterium]
MKKIKNWFNWLKFHFLIRRHWISQLKKGKLPGIEKITDLGREGLILHFKDGSEGLIEPKKTKNMADT